MSGFDHERLDVYAVAIDFVVLANEVVERLPRGRGYLADQLQRAATSIPLDICSARKVGVTPALGRSLRTSTNSSPRSLSASRSPAPPAASRARGNWGDTDGVWY